VNDQEETIRYQLIHDLPMHRHGAGGGGRCDDGKGVLDGPSPEPAAERVHRDVDVDAAGLLPLKHHCSTAVKGDKKMASMIDSLVVVQSVVAAAVDNLGIGYKGKYWSR
jgi:hypothetical protein